MPKRTEKTETEEFKAQTIKTEGSITEGFQTEEIKTEKAERLASMTHLIRRFLHYYRPSCPGFPLKPPEMGVMVHVGRYWQLHGKWPSPSMISKEILLSRPAITAILNSLEEQGYVRRAISPVDRRRFTVELTPLGQQLTRDAFGQFCRTTEMVIETLGEEDSRKFQELLEKVTAAMEHEKGATR